MHRFKEQLDFLISVHEIEEIFIQTVTDCQNALSSDPVKAMVNPLPQIVYQAQTNILVSGLTSNSIQVLTHYCTRILTQNPQNGFGLALQSSLQAKASAQVPSDTQRQSTSAWSAVLAAAPPAPLSTEALTLKDQLSALMAWEEDDDYREILHNLDSFYQMNKKTCLLALHELLRNEHQRKQFIALVKKIFDLDCTNSFARWLAETIGKAIYPEINDIKEIPIQTNTTEETLIALSFYATQTRKDNKGSLLYDATRLMSQHYDQDIFNDSNDIFILLFKSSFIPNKTKLLLSEKKILVLYQ